MSRRRVMRVAALATLLAIMLPGTALAAAGDRDSGFGGDGTVILPTGGTGGAEEAVTWHHKIIVAGSPYFSGQADIVVARFGRHGNPDSTCDGDGMKRIDLGGNESVDGGLAVLPDGRIVVGGYLSDTNGDYHLYLIRLTQSCQLDHTFGGGDGIVVDEVGPGQSDPYTILVKSNGKIVMAGGRYPTDGDGLVTLWQYNANGTLDTSFGGGSGYVSIDYGPGFDEAWKILEQPDGKLLVSGWAEVPYGHDYDAMLARFNANGTVDTTFGDEGIITYNPSSDPNEGFIGVAILNNRIYTCDGGDGPADQDVVIMRFKMDGVRDKAFDGDGKEFIDIGGKDECTDMAVDSAGRLLISGNTDADMFASRLNAAGVVDTGFGTGGVATPAVAGTNRGLALQPNGKILLVGQDGPGNFMVARFLP